MPLVVARCHRHGVAFTVYPPAYVPYGRVAVLAVDLEGRRVKAAPDSPVPVANTLWEAAVDAEAGRRWPETGGLVASRRTQGRWLTMGAQLLGLCSETEAPLREPLATALRVPTLTLRDAAEILKTRLVLLHRSTRCSNRQTR